MRNVVTTLLAALALILQAGARPPAVKSLGGDESIQIEVMVLASGVGSHEYLFTREKVVIKEDRKVIGELVLTDEEKSHVDEFLGLIAKKHDDHTAHVTTYKMTHRRGGRVLSTVSCEVGSELRETKKKVISLAELTRWVSKPR